MVVNAALVFWGGFRFAFGRVCSPAAGGLHVAANMPFLADRTAHNFTRGGGVLRRGRNSPPTRRNAKSASREARHELVILPYYSVFDNLGYEARTWHLPNLRFNPSPTALVVGTLADGQADNRG